MHPVTDHPDFGDTVMNRKTYVISTILGIGSLFLVGLAAGQVNMSSLDMRDGLLYLADTSTPYSGEVEDQGRSIGNVNEGKREGEWRWVFENGETERLMKFEAGVLQWRGGWHENGQEESSLAYQNGRPHGPMQHWDADGTLRERHIYVDGLLEGLEEIFDHHGQKTVTSEYSNGVRQGATIWWFNNDAKRWETHYENGERAGTWTQYTLDGDVIMRSHWSEGKLIARDEDPHAGH